MQRDAVGKTIVTDGHQRKLRIEDPLLNLENVQQIRRSSLLPQAAEPKGFAVLSQHFFEMALLICQQRLAGE